MWPIRRSGSSATTDLRGPVGRSRGVAVGAIGAVCDCRRRMRPSASYAAIGPGPLVAHRAGDPHLRMPPVRLGGSPVPRRGRRGPPGPSPASYGPWPRRTPMPAGRVCWPAVGCRPGGSPPPPHTPQRSALPAPRECGRPPRRIPPLRTLRRGALPGSPVRYRPWPRNRLCGVRGPSGVLLRHVTAPPRFAADRRGRSRRVARVVVQRREWPCLDSNTGEMQGTCVGMHSVAGHPWWALDRSAGSGVEYGGGIRWRGQRRTGGRPCASSGARAKVWI